MRGTVHLVVIAAASLAVGCATTIEVAFDEERDFSQYRTWDWEAGASVVEAAPGEGRSLAVLAARLVHEELRSRGLVRARGGAELRVSFALRVQRQLVTVNETGAESLLSSYHASPSYRIQVTTQRTEVYDTGKLEIVVTHGERGPVVWRGALRTRRSGDFTHYLPTAVSQLLGRFPATPHPRAQPRAPQQLASHPVDEPGRDVVHRGDAAEPQPVGSSH